MKLTPKRAEELRKRGIPVDPSQIVRPEKKPEAPVSRDTNVIPQILGNLIEVMKASEGNISAILEMNACMLEGMTKKRNFRCTIGRNSRGDMSTVDIEEK